MNDSLRGAFRCQWDIWREMRNMLTSGNRAGLEKQNYNGQNTFESHDNETMGRRI